LDPGGFVIEGFAHEPLFKSIKGSVVPSTTNFVKCLPKSELLLHVVTADDTTTKTDAESKKLSVDSEIDSLVEGLYTELITKHQFTGRDGKSCCGRVGRSAHFTHAALVDLGPPSPPGVECSSFAFGVPSGAAPSRCAKSIGCKCITATTAALLGSNLAGAAGPLKVASAVISLKDVKLCSSLLRVLVENFLLKLMTDERFKSKKSTKPNFFHLNSLEVFMSEGCCSLSQSDIDLAITEAAVHARAIDSSRQLTTSPPNYCNPVTLSNYAANMASELGMECTILNMKDLEAKKMGAFVAVGKGSLFPPHLIHLRYKGEPIDGAPLKKLCLVGKGLTTDTGGYNLKVNSLIEIMKLDMGGASAVLGAARCVATLKPKGIDVNFIVGAAENMISAQAYRPGDVLTASNGTTIEVINTDAEGRLVLCDCLVYAESLAPVAIVTLATLTGAAMVGAGRDLAMLYSTSQEAMQLILSSAQVAGEPMWPMPLHGAYRPDLDSRCADIANAANNRYGGSIHAALFLREFVKSTTFCHIDMAGPAWNFKEQRGTGYGVRTLVELCQQVAAGRTFQ